MRSCASGRGTAAPSTATRIDVASICPIQIGKDAALPGHLVDRLEQDDVLARGVERDSGDANLDHAVLPSTRRRLTHIVGVPLVPGEGWRTSAPPAYRHQPTLCAIFRLHFFGPCATM